MFGSTAGSTFGSVGGAVSSISSSMYSLATSSTVFKYLLGLIVWLLDKTCGIDCIQNNFPNYVNYLTWFLILIFAILPVLFILNLYISCLLYHIYRNRREVLEDVKVDMKHRDWRSACRRITAALWYATSRIWNGYEIVYHPKALEILKRNASIPKSSILNVTNSSQISSTVDKALPDQQIKISRENNKITAESRSQLPSQISDTDGARRRNRSQSSRAVLPQHSEISSDGDGPPQIPTMIVYYHGALPVDLYYYVMWNVLESGMRPIHLCVDRFLFKVPGFSAALKFWNCIPGPRDKIIESLKNGNVVALSPGGTREAVFSKNYQLLWGKRVGFADCLLAALEASETGNVALIPMFSKNCRSMFDYPDFCKHKWIRRFYDSTKWPIYPLCGGLPVKVTTYIGEPLIIERGNAPSALKLAQEAKHRVKHLIKVYQEVDSESSQERHGFLKNILFGIIERFQRVRREFDLPRFPRLQRDSSRSD